MEAKVKKEVLLSSLILATSITPQSFAQAESILNQAATTNSKTFQTPLFYVRNPFTSRNFEIYAVITMTKEGYKLEDLNFGKVTHHVQFQFFNKDGSEFKEFELQESDDGGWFMELRGASSTHKSYVLWSCSSTLNCGFESPGFVHVSFDEQNPKKEIHYTVNLPFFHSTENEIQKDRIHIHFDADFSLTK